MEYVYAALLLHKLGKPVSEEGIRKVIEAAGGIVDEVRVKALVNALQGINIDEAIKSASALQVPAVAPAPTQAPAAQQERAEKPKEEKREEEALAGLSALFG